MLLLRFVVAAAALGSSHSQSSPRSPRREARAQTPTLSRNDVLEQIAAAKDGRRLSSQWAALERPSRYLFTACQGVDDKKLEELAASAAAEGAGTYKFEKIIRQRPPGFL